VVADVLVTDRMTLGQSRTVAMSTSNKIGLVLFDATQGQRVSVKVNTSTITAGTISILSPTGAVLSSSTFNTTSGYLDTPRLTAGTYTILIDPTGTNTGNVNFTLNDASDLLGTLTIGDPTTVFTITTPGQNAHYLQWHGWTTNQPGPAPGDHWVVNWLVNSDVAPNRLGNGRPIRNHLQIIQNRRIGLLIGNGGIPKG